MDIDLGAIRIFWFVDTGDLPRCSGAASPEAIDYCCIDENVQHEWAVSVDWAYGERIVYCNLCGREKC